MVYKKQDMLSGFTDGLGNKMSVTSLEAYNNFTKKINKSANIAVESGSLTQRERDFYLDQRHKFLVAFFEVVREK